ncbi:hypothetical protein [Pseudomonas moorei]|uniref:hypothetical protein n=1 Tax=Pseudomonas moorei TaxID=395599 RepID=UPI00200F5FFA|nr:hypothetical protein [Pseudomonas moorei]
MADLPALLEKNNSKDFPVLVQYESGLLAEARKLFDSEMYPYALLAIWNAAVHNLRRRVESYGVDLWVSVAKDESGRKKHDKDGESLSERWSGVDDLVLISGSTKLGLLNKKAGKALEMINWMRNHASPAHDSDHHVEQEDVVALVLLLQKNLFENPMPDPGHSVAGLFEPVKNKQLSTDKITTLSDEVKGLKQADLRVAFGFLLDLLCQGEEPTLKNAKGLMPAAWEKAPEELRKVVGLRYHANKLDPDSDNSSDKGAATRLLDFLTEVDGIKYIPDSSRARLYRVAAKKLADAKDTSYGWPSEEKAAKTLSQFGPWVPSVAFEEVYQEILAVWCGNYWGRSSAHSSLTSFIEELNTTQIRQVVKFFITNERVKSELSQHKPKKQAVTLLNALSKSLTIQSHKDEVQQALDEVNDL